jgi:maleate isomerase
MWSGDFCTPAQHALMNEDLEQSARYLGSVRPDVIAYACTSGSFEDGPEGEQRIVDVVTAATGAEVVTATRAIVAFLQRAGVGRVAIVSPYTRELTRDLEAYLVAAGLTITGVACRGYDENDRIAADEPDDIVAFASAAELGAAEAVVLPCTNWRVNGIVRRLEAALRRPVISSNTALIEHVARVLDLDPVAGTTGAFTR